MVLQVQHPSALMENSSGQFWDSQLHHPNSKPNHLQLCIAGWSILFLNNSWFMTFVFPLLFSSNLIVL